MHSLTPSGQMTYVWLDQGAGDIMQSQQSVMREQDKGLDLLAQSIARQKQMGMAIGNEIDDQNGTVPNPASMTRRVFSALYYC